MKALAWLLALANLLALAWWQGWLERWMPSGREPARVAGQVAPERLRVVPQERFEATLAIARGPCLEVGPLDDAALQRVAAWGGGLTDAKGELDRPSYRVRFAMTLARDELDARRSQLAGLAGREPTDCTPR